MNKKRENLLQDIALHEVAKKSVREMERLRRKERQVELIKEAKLRRMVRGLLNELKISNKIPHDSTGINVLQQLLKKIVPVIEENYKSLTTSVEQRKSFRAHIIHAIINTVKPPRALRKAEVDYLLGDDLKPIQGPDDVQQIQEAEMKINVGEAEDEDDKPPGFIDVNGAGEPDEVEQFGSPLEGLNLDATGRNVAFECYRKVEKTVIEAYSLLDNDIDRQVFFNYLVTNVKLYMDRFETELRVTLGEPDNQVYSDIIGGATVPQGTGEQGIPAGDEAQMNQETMPMAGDSATPDMDPQSAEFIDSVDELEDVRQIAETRRFKQPLNRSKNRF